MRIASLVLVGVTCGARSAADVFGAAPPVAGFDTPLEEGDIWLSADGRTALMSRGPNLLDLDLYEARR